MTERVRDNSFAALASVRSAGGKAQGKNKVIINEGDYDEREKTSNKKCINYEKWR